ncbi:MAG TPA: MotA/TolQ/ExbB proton channel family protein [Baekduia sp.]|uniref:MotA/TolQ/ExbB proton channel family protein n=1 Tax=Baekduia sp. TaxID=2600305 RepID=UPI002D787724|nr:MotA/TolQ/ExbB proton channel family protein [Baekduia sp.]HET6508062.1 MotA/TolQ/ExbB proton channel family protein [Baekduia sp.]
MILAALDLGDALSRIAQGLKYPVLVASIVLLLLVAAELGRFAVESWRRRRTPRGTLRLIAAQALAEPGVARHVSERAPSAIAAQAVRDLGIAGATGRDRAIEHALADYELAVQRRLDRTRLLVRGGPALGLMGTLIPLAPGLAALGRGDVASLADDLRTAFGATVIGLLVGTVAFALTIVRTRAATEDLVALERAVDDARPATAGAPVAPPAPEPVA